MYVDISAHIVSDLIDASIQEKENTATEMPVDISNAQQPAARLVYLYMMVPTNVYVRNCMFSLFDAIVGGRRRLQH